MTWWQDRCQACGRWIGPTEDDIHTVHIKNMSKEDNRYGFWNLGLAHKNCLEIKHRINMGEKHYA